jgi:hypothetical protein
MNYSDIVVAALAYSDRQDSEVSNNMGHFIRVVETRVNRKLKVQSMTVRSATPTVAGQEYYGLPEDFAGIRDIELREEMLSQARDTLQFLTPEQMNQYSNNTGSKVYYTIIANQLQIMPAQESNKVLEIIYYRKVPNLNSTDTENWLSTQNPDVYIFGILVEISAFTKDSEAAVLWEARFSVALDEIALDDAITRWSGPPLTVRSENV